MSDSTPFPPFFEEPALRLRMLRRRIWHALTDSPVLRLLAAMALLTSGYVTLFLLLGGW